MTVYANRVPMRARPLTARIVRALRLGAPSLLLGAAWLVPAVATAAKPPVEYSLSIVEGETTLPEDAIVNMSGLVRPPASIALSITRNGLEVVRSTGGDGGVWTSQVPQVGDVVSLESPIGNPVGAVVYDGLPSLDATVCAGSTDFSGQRTGVDPVEGGYYSLVPRAPYKIGLGQAQVTTLAGPAYSGNFLIPLALGQTVWASESLRTPLAGGAVFEYSSENVRPVGTCPKPPAPPPPPPPPPALLGSTFKLTKTTIRKLLKHGWPTEVTINQPGTVTEDLYTQNGALPAFASSAGKGARHRKRRPAPALLLARGIASAKSAGIVHVLITVTARGRKALAHAHSVRAILITTLRDAAGAKFTLAPRAVKLKR